MANTPSAPRRSWPGWRRSPNTGTRIQHRSCGVGSVVGDENASANADIGREARVPTAASPCEDAGRPVMATHMTSDPLVVDLQPSPRLISVRPFKETDGQYQSTPNRSPRLEYIPIYSNCRHSYK